MSSRPRNQVGSGGIEKLASLLSIATIAATSARFQASTKRATRSRERASPSARSVACCERAGRSRSSFARARCRALFTEATEVPRISAVSRALKPSTSHRSSAARWLGGRSWRAAT